MYNFKSMIIFGDTIHTETLAEMNIFIEVIAYPVSSHGSCLNLFSSESSSSMSMTGSAMYWPSDVRPVDMKHQFNVERRNHKIRFLLPVGQ